MAKNKKKEPKREGQKRLASTRPANPLSSVSGLPGVRVALESTALGLFVAAPLVSEGAPEQFANWFPYFLWLLVAAVLVGQKLLAREFQVHFSKIDAFIYATCFWIALSGILTASLGWGHARPTINASWQWFGYAVVFFVIRQLSVSRPFRVAALYCLIFVAVGCSASGVYQQFIVYPEIRRNYESQTEEKKQELIRRAGLNNVEPGSPARIMWENRLSATEPTSTFVLANSLAAFLAPSMVVALALLINGFVRGDKFLVWAFTVALICIFICLVLTKSRTAYLAILGGGGGLLWMCFRESNKKVPWKFVMGVVVSCLLVVAVAMGTGMFDAQVISESAKSMLYRLEYWQASLDLIYDNLWFGCGPGNFQHSYAKYQLVQSSETVADPHNFLVEVWAIGGIPAGCSLLMAGIFWILSLKSRRPLVDVDDRESQAAGDNEIGDSKRIPGLLTTSLLIAGIVGIAVAFLNTAETSLVAIASLISFCMAICCRRSKISLLIPDHWFYRTVNFALVTLLIALSASGGIGIPGVAIVGISLLAISLSKFASCERPNCESPRSPGFDSRQFCLVFMILMIVGAVLFFRLTVYDPIQNAREHYRVSELAALNSRLEPALVSLERAIHADPYDGNFLFFKSQMVFRKFQGDPTLKNLQELQDIAEKSVTFRPNNSKVALETGKIFLSILLDKEELDQNIRTRISQQANLFFKTATERRPNDALHAAFRSYSFLKTGDMENAKIWSVTAMQLDKLNLHRDKDLSNTPFRIGDFESKLNIEQELIAIRNQ